MIRKHKLLSTFLIVILAIALLVSLAACDLSIYVPEPIDPDDVPDPEPLPMTPEFNLYVHANGGRLLGTPVGSEESLPKFYVVKKGANYSPQISSFVRDGYTLLGWCSDENLTTFITSFVMPGTDFHVYAKWEATPPVDVPEPDPEYSKISFDLNDRKIPDTVTAPAPLIGEAGKSIASEEIIALPLPSERPGYDFAGWYYDTATTNPFVFENAVYPDYDIVLYAKWQIKTYTVTFDTGEGATPVSPQKIHWGNKITVPLSTSREGYVFEGWYLPGEIDKVDFMSLVVTADLTIEARWTERVITINFEWVGIPSVRAKVGDRVEKPADPIRSGYNFLGWYENKRPQAGELAFDFTKLHPTNTASITLYPVWSLKDKALVADISSDSVIGKLYPSDDALWEPVYTYLNLSAKATEETSSFTTYDRIEFTVEVWSLEISYDGKKVTLTDKSEIANLITIEYNSNDAKILPDEVTKLRIDFKLSADAPIEYANATFDIAVKIHITDIISDGESVGIDNIDIINKLN